MEKQFKSLCRRLFLSLMTATIILGVPAMGAGAANAAPVVASKTAASPTVASREVCLNCHGPFNKLAAASARFVAPSGEKIVPHRFVPHDSREAKAIPGCDNCHAAHPVPLTAPALTALPKPDVQWCYTACHHKDNFTPCKDCHK